MSSMKQLYYSRRKFNAMRNCPICPGCAASFRHNAILKIVFRDVVECVRCGEIFIIEFDQLNKYLAEFGDMDYDEGVLV